MEVRIEPQADYVHVVAKGAFDAAAAGEGIARVVAACVERNLERVLIDGRSITNAVSVLERYEFAKTLAEQARSRIRMAIVVSRENMFSKTLEETARNLGMDVRTTDSMAEGLIDLDLPLGSAGRA
ncbi:MAG TPA: hypothetical protein VFP36_02595 [Usitatibacter sp.]|nr:hypothetical protein [Usitatibacter sp.]